MTAKIGFIGLGTMGKWMALNMLKAGFPLKVYDINSAAVQFLTGQGAEEAKITVMFGGDEALFGTLRPALDAIGNQIVYMGAVGSGQLTKLINQLLFNISCAGLAEVLPMAVKLGLAPEKVTQVVTTGTGRSFAADFFLPLTLQNRFDEGYPVKSAYKDMISAAEISAHKGIPLPVVNATAVTFQMAMAQGFGDLSKGGLIRVFEQMLNTEFRAGKRF